MVKETAQAKLTQGEESSKERGLKKRQQGVVISNKMTKTVVVAVTRQVRHRAYGKFVRRTRKYMAHAPENNCGEGDVVQIVETRPMSRHKRWKVEKVITKAA